MSDQLKDLTPDTNRGTERQPLPDEVTVAIESVTLRGSGENVSHSGVFFIADEVIRVRVSIGGKIVDGDLVRVESHGHGRTGIAIRFDEASEPLPLAVDADVRAGSDAGPDAGSDGGPKTS